LATPSEVTTTDQQRFTCNLTIFHAVYKAYLKFSAIWCSQVIWCSLRVSLCDPVT